MQTQFLLRAALLASLLPSVLSAGDRAKNVILFLGDAGGPSTLHAASVHTYGDPNRFFIQKMAHIGLSETSAADDWVTDSAAGMTAIVTGQKTKNGVISQSDAAVKGKDDGIPLKTILEYAEERGLSTGVITNDAVTGATPAACFAHVNDRKYAAQIFTAALNPRFGNGVDLLIGAGRTKLLATFKEAGRDIESEISKQGYSFLSSIDGLGSDARRAVVLLDDNEFDIGAATRAAISILSKNPKGYFLMVESDLHADKLPRGFDRFAKFDQVIESTVKNVRKDTLVLFTADHSFDLRISRRAAKGAPLLTVGADGKTVLAPAVTQFGHHSAEPVLVAADGPGADQVRGFMSNTDLFRVMMSAYGWKESKSAD